MADVRIEFTDPGEKAQKLRLPFPPLTTSHILNCSYHFWHPKYRTITPKARLIPLTSPFLSYLRADGIVLPSDDDSTRRHWSDSDSGIFSSTEHPNDSDDDDEEDHDVADAWRDVHQRIQSTIEELDGKVVPKLNWSAPKDATWISTLNSMECRSPNDIYLLLKSSDFVSHDLDHAFDDCVSSNGKPLNVEAKAEAIGKIPYYLVLRKYFQLNPALEFRCFVRKRKLIGICQRDLNHFEFLFKMEDRLRQRILEFFELRLRDTFPDESFAFDVYIPPPHDRVWLVDINPWAQRTDPLLFSWMELLTWGEAAAVVDGADEDADGPEEIESGTKKVRFVEAEIEDDAEQIYVPEMRLIQRDDPEAYNFNTPQYSAHKLPREVVDATNGGQGQLREFAEQWKEILYKQWAEDEDDSD